MSRAKYASEVVLLQLVLVKGYSVSSSPHWTKNLSLAVSVSPRTLKRESAAFNFAPRNSTQADHDMKTEQEAINDLLL